MEQNHQVKFKHSQIKVGLKKKLISKLSNDTRGRCAVMSAANKKTFFSSTLNT